MICNIFIGALTNKPYAFKNRPWELNNVYSVDILDSMGSNIIIYLYGTEIRRILPLKNDKINEDWISNRSRYFFEGLHKWRLNIPLIKKKKNYIYISWFQSFYFLFLKIWFYSIFLKTKTIGLILNFLLDMELVITSKILMFLMGFNVIKNNNIPYINDYYLFYINPLFFEEILKKDIYLFLGINIRLEAPILNIKLRKNVLKDNLIYLNIGNMYNDNLNSVNLGINIKKLVKFLKGKLNINIYINKFIKKKIKKNKIINKYENYYILIGNNLILQKDNWNIYNILLEKFFLKKKEKIILNQNYLLKNFFIEKLKYKKIVKNNLIIPINIIFLNLIYLLYEEFFYLNVHSIKNSSQLDILYIINGNFQVKKKKNKFIIYQGHLLDINILNIDLILPNITFLECSNKFLNKEGLIIQTNKVLTRPNYSRKDWMILNAIYIFILNLIKKIFKFQWKKKNYLTFNRFYIQLKNIKKIYKYIKRFSVNFIFNEVSKYNWYNNLIFNIVNKKIKTINKIFFKIIENYNYNIYTINIMDKNSKTLKLASYNFSQNMRNYMNI